MGSRSGDYSQAGGSLYNELDRYVGALVQQTKPIPDRQLNEVVEALLTQMRRNGAMAIGAGGRGTHWLVAAAASPTNNFKVTGGGGTAETAARMFAGGHVATLAADVDYVSTNKQIHPLVTAVATTILTDSSANYAVNELVGRILVPDVDNPGTTFTIASNTATTITVSSGDLTTATSIGKSYRVNLSTPGGARSDDVYLDLFYDEIDATEDPNIRDNIPSLGLTESFRKLRLQTFVRVRENGTLPAAYVDADGNQHTTVLLARLSRTASATIAATQIDDRRVQVRRQSLPILTWDPTTFFSAPTRALAGTSNLFDTTVFPDGSTTEFALRVHVPAGKGLGDAVLRARIAPTTSQAASFDLAWDLVPPTANELGPGALSGTLSITPSATAEESAVFDIATISDLRAGFEFVFRFRRLGGSDGHSGGMRVYSFWLDFPEA